MWLESSHCDSTVLAGGLTFRISNKLPDTDDAAGPQMIPWVEYFICSPFLFSEVAENMFLYCNAVWGQGLPKPAGSCCLDPYFFWWNLWLNTPTDWNGCLSLGSYFVTWNWVKCSMWYHFWITSLEYLNGNCGILGYGQFWWVFIRVVSLRKVNVDWLLRFKQYLQVSWWVSKLLVSLSSQIRMHLSNKVNMRAK